MDISPFKAVYPNLDFITSAESFFGTVKESYPDYKQSGFFHHDDEEAVFIYRIKTSRGKHIGIIACATVKDYLDGKIKKHENTLASKEQQQMNLLLRRGASVKPVLLTYPNVEALDLLIKKQIKKQKPFFTITFDENGETHTFWKIKGKSTIKKIQALFKAHIPHTYIADGHHRTSTTALMAKRMKEEGNKGNFDQILAAFFPVKELSIFDYNRVVEGLDDRTIARFMTRISQVFDIEILGGPAKPQKKHELTMAVGEEWFRLKWKLAILTKYRRDPVLLDANLLDVEVMQNIMNIEDTRTDSRVSYVEGPKGFDSMTKKTRQNENKVAFCLFPVDVKDLFLVADNHDTMPPKSTWFEPRVKNGLLVLEYDAFNIK